MTRLTFLLCLALCPVLVACGDNQDPDGAKELWSAIRASNYRDWERAPGYAERRSSNAPHGDAVDIYINPTLATALANGGDAQTWPTGATIIKDGYDGGDLEYIAVMEKRLTGWYFAEYDPDGEAIYSGKPDLCVDCHRSGDDFVLAFDFPEP